MSVTKETKQILAALTTFAIVVTFCFLPLMLQPNLSRTLYISPLHNFRLAGEKHTSLFSHSISDKEKKC